LRIQFTGGDLNGMIRKYFTINWGRVDLRSGWRVKIDGMLLQIVCEKSFEVQMHEKLLRENGAFFCRKLLYF
jgi:hypothetical protein